MARMHRWLGIAATVVALSGCVSQEKYNAMKLKADQLAEQATQSESEASAQRSRADAEQRQLDAFATSGSTRDALLKNDQDQIAGLTQDLAKAKSDLEAALNKAPVVINSGMVLPPALSNALSDFAAQNADIVDFDAAKGVVKFKSDVTFASGSSKVSDNAAKVISRFAQILNSPAAAGYDLMVAGHTDNTRVSRADTIAAGNKDNWYLSAHRAIAVAAELYRNSVSLGRLGVAGYADQRPIASNSTESGRATNRRVEILILPTTAHNTVASGSEQPHATPRVKLNKDSSTPAADHQPAMNK